MTAWKMRGGLTRRCLSTGRPPPPEEPADADADVLALAPTDADALAPTDADAREVPAHAVDKHQIYSIKYIANNNITIIILLLLKT